MELLQPVINWFTERGGKYEGDSSPALYQAENGAFSGEIYSPYVFYYIRI